MIGDNSHTQVIYPRGEAGQNAEVERIGAVGSTAEVAVIDAAVRKDAHIPNEDQPLHVPDLAAVSL